VFQRTTGVTPLSRTINTPSARQSRLRDTCDRCDTLDSEGSSSLLAHDYAGGMEQRAEQVTYETATPEQLADARENFRRKWRDAEERQTPESKARLDALFGRDKSAA
jgi:hypothetical protein